MSCGIYKITNKINGKVYIGQSIDIHRRWKQHKSYAKKNIQKPLYRSIKKYNIKNFKFEILEECAVEKLDELEIKYIKEYNSFIGWENSNGYNLTVGGMGANGYKHTKQHRDNIKKARAGKYYGIYSPNRKKVYCDGRIFETTKLCADYYGIDKLIMKSWLNGSNNMPKTFIDMNLHHVGEDKTYKIKERIICEGKFYHTVKDCADFYGVTEKTLQSYITKKIMPKKWYDKELHKVNEDFSMYTIGVGSGNNNANSKKVICDNIIYNSITECADFYDINKVTMNDWLNQKVSMPKNFIDLDLRFYGDNTTFYTKRTKRKKTFDNSKRVICDNKIFNSIKECEEHYNTSMIGKWLRGKSIMPQEFINMGLSFIDEETKIKITNGNNKKVICEGLIYETIKECAEYYNINPTTMRTWLNGICGTPQFFINANLSYIDEKNKTKPRIGSGNNSNYKSVICNGLIFKSITSCSKYYNIEKHTMGRWLKGQNSMPQNFINMGLRYLEDENFIPKKEKSTRGGNNPYAKKVICDNIMYGCIKNCADYYNINRGTMNCWLTGSRTMPQKYIDLGLRYYNPEVDGDIEQYEQYIETKVI